MNSAQVSVHAWWFFSNVLPWNCSTISCHHDAATKAWMVELAGKQPPRWSTGHQTATLLQDDHKRNQGCICIYMYDLGPWWTAISSAWDSGATASSCIRVGFVLCGLTLSTCSGNVCEWAAGWRGRGGWEQGIPERILLPPVDRTPLLIIWRCSRIGRNGRH